VFKDVEDNAQRQYRQFSSTNSELIEDYYPELHEKGAPPVACTTGANLIPDLMTRRCILVDLDDLKTEEALIDRFGVDKAFLQELQSRNLVRIATNLEPDRHPMLSS